MKLLYGNFDFEHDLEPSGPRMLPERLRRIHAELAFCLVTNAEPGDFVWAPEPPDEEYRRHLAQIGLPDVQFVHRAAEVPPKIALQPWGWSERISQWARKHGWTGDHPDLSTVRSVNSRDFSSRLEREWNVAPSSARPVYTVDEFCDAVAHNAPSAGWIVKANFGMSARQRILGRESPPTASAMNWVQKQLLRNPPLYFEPWLTRVEEVGFQYTIPRSGEPVLNGATPLFTDEQGTYRGSRLAAVPEADVVAVVERAAREIQRLGYFGPLGIDAMKYRLPDGSTRWRPLQDINARWTMGRLALGLKRIVKPKQHATWLHVRFTGAVPEIADRLARLEASFLDEIRILRTSPLLVGGRPVRHGTILVTAPSAARLLDAERMVAAASDQSSP